VLVSDGQVASLVTPETDVERNARDRVIGHGLRVSKSYESLLGTAHIGEGELVRVVPPGV